MTSDLKTCYRYQRQSNPALVAMVMARKDVAAGRTRYVPYPGSRYEREYVAHGNKMRWIETPEQAGLRFVGYADELCSSIWHQGWYSDGEYQEGCLRGAVYQLPSRNRVEQFVYGYKDDNNPPGANLCFDVTSDKDSAARYADGIAECVAEDESEYQEAWRAGRRFEDCADEMSGIRKTALALIKELKTVFVGGTESCAVMRRAVQDSVEALQKLRDSRAQLLADFGDRQGFTE